MERDQEWIIAMAKALGTNSGFSVPIVPDVRAFRALFEAIAAREREACAQLAERTYEGGCPNSEDGDSGFDFMGENSAAAIRQRSNG